MYVRMYVCSHATKGEDLIYIYMREREYANSRPTHITYVKSTQLISIGRSILHLPFTISDMV